MKIKANEIVIQGTCVRYTHDGKGIINYQGVPIYVDGLLLGEKAQISLTKANDKYGFGTIKKLLEPHPGRVTPKCPYYEDCGGCQLQHMNSSTQWDMKQHRVELLIKKAVRQKVKINPIIGMKNPFNYRNKSLVPMGITKQNAIVAGYYALGTHQIIPMEECLIDDPLVNTIINSLKKILKSLQIKLYEPSLKQSFLSHVLVRRGIKTNQTMIVLITLTPRFPHIQKVVQELLKIHPEITTILHQVRRPNSRDVYGDKEYCLYGQGWIEDELSGYRFRINSRSFFQINPLQTEVLYEKAIQMARLSPNDHILDAYCGVGTIGIMASRWVKQVTGVEIIEEAIANAHENADLNKLTNLRFYTDDAGDFIQHQYAKGVHFDVVFVDPPRLGLSKSFLDALMKMRPAKIMYISCDPSTLARDLNVLQRAYEIREIQLVDLFPQTFHVETVVALVLRS